MSLKKYLKRSMGKITKMNKFMFSKIQDRMGQALRLRSGQAVLEYFVLLVVIALLTIAGVTAFSNVHSKTEQFTNTAISLIAP
jgi:hypothetical protein